MSYRVTSTIRVSSFALIAIGFVCVVFVSWNLGFEQKERLVYGWYKWFGMVSVLCAKNMKSIEA